MWLRKIKLFWMSIFQISVEAKELAEGYREIYDDAERKK